MTAGDVVRAVREQNSQVATGIIGTPPVRGDQQIEVTLSTLGRLDDVEQFENIIVKSTPEGRLVRIKDVGRVELGARNEDFDVMFDGQPTVLLVVFQTPDANALDTHDLVLAKMDELQATLSGRSWLGYRLRHHAVHPRDHQRSVQDPARRGDPGGHRGAGVLAELAVRHHSAVGRAGGHRRHVRRDGHVRLQPEQSDAVRPGAGHRHRGRRRDRGGRGRRASYRGGIVAAAATVLAMQQVSGPVIAVAAVLSAVFVPCAFISGITGQFFRQFALTISVSTIISAFNSLTLSPALTALLLRPKAEQAASGVLPWFAYAAGRRLAGLGAAERAPGQSFSGEHVAGRMHSVGCSVHRRRSPGCCVTWPVNKILGWRVLGVQRAFDAMGTAYTWSVGKLLRVSVLVLVVYGGLLAADLSSNSSTTPKGFIPGQDMGYLLVNVQLPDSASVERTAAVHSSASRRSCCDHTGRAARDGHHRAIVRARTPLARISARCSSAWTSITIAAIRACRAWRSSPS